MKIFLITFLTIFTLTNAFGQNNTKTYLAHGHNYSTMYSYSIREIIIHPDSNYTLKNYWVFNKREWKTYKQYEPKISNGKITKKDDYWLLTEYRNNNKTDFSWIVKISDKKIIFYFPNRKGKMRRTAVYKRIDTK